MVSPSKQFLADADVWQVRHTAPVPSVSVRRWVSNCAAMCLPEQVYWCDGSAREREMLRERAQLNEGFRVGMSAFLSQAQVEVEPVDGAAAEAKTSGELRPLFRGCMRGRTMYVAPFVTRGGDGVSVRGVQVSDSPAVALALMEANVSGQPAWTALDRKGPGLFLVHGEGRCALPGPCVWSFPEAREVWALGPEFDTLTVVKALRYPGPWS